MIGYRSFDVSATYLFGIDAIGVAYGFTLL